MMQHSKLAHLAAGVVIGAAAGGGAISLANPSSDRVAAKAPTRAWLSVSDANSDQVVSARGRQTQPNAFTGTLTVHRLLEPGDHVLRVVLTDPKGKKSRFSWDVTVHPR